MAEGIGLHYLLSHDEIQNHTFGELLPIAVARLNAINPFNFPLIYDRAKSETMTGIYYYHNTYNKPPQRRDKESVQKLLQERERLLQINQGTDIINNSYVALSSAFSTWLLEVKDATTIEEAYLSKFTNIDATLSWIIYAELALVTIEWGLINNKITLNDIEPLLAHSDVSNCNDLIVALMLGYWTYNRQDLREDAIELLQSFIKNHPNGNMYEPWGGSWGQATSQAEWIIDYAFINNSFGEYLTRFIIDAYKPLIDKLSPWLKPLRFGIAYITLDYLYYTLTGERVEQYKTFQDALQLSKENTIKWSASNHEYELCYFWGNVTGSIDVLSYLHINSSDADVIDTLEQLFANSNQMFISL